MMNIEEIKTMVRKEYDKLIEETYDIFTDELYKTKGIFKKRHVNSGLIEFLIKEGLDVLVQPFSYRFVLFSVKTETGRVYFYGDWEYGGGIVFISLDKKFITHDIYRAILYADKHRITERELEDIRRKEYNHWLFRGAE